MKTCYLWYNPWRDSYATTNSTVRTVYYSAVQCSAVRYSTVQCSAVQYSTVQYSTVQCSTVRYITIQYNTIQYIILYCIHAVALKLSTTAWTAEGYFSNMCHVKSRYLALELLLVATFEKIFVFSRDSQMVRTSQVVPYCLSYLDVV